MQGSSFSSTEVDPALMADRTYRTHLDMEGTIRTTAYYRYLEREEAGQPGTDVEDWVTAEQDVLRS